MSTDADWNRAAEVMMLTTLGQAPVIGGFLDALVGVYWPVPGDSPVDIWSLIQDQVQALIDTDIAEERYAAVQANLGSQAQQTGLIGILNNYNDALAGTNGEDPATLWASANTNFIETIALSQQSGSEAALLPLFAQMVNLHLTLLRDGYQRGYCNISALRQRIGLYTLWANTYMPSPPANTTAGTCNPWNATNIPARIMQVNVATFCTLWQFLDPVLYSNAIESFPAQAEVFYTASEMASPDVPQGNFANFDPPAGLSGNVIGVSAWDLYISDPYNCDALCGVQVSYDNGAGSTGYQGYPWQQAPNGNGDPAWITSFGVSPTNPLTSVSGGYHPDYNFGTINWLQFTFQDGSQTSVMPYDHHGSSTNWTIPPTDTPLPTGYYLSSIYQSGTGQSNEVATVDAPADVAFGFRKDSTGPPIQSNPIAVYGSSDSVWASTIADLQGKSTYWVPGYSVQYAMTWSLPDGVTSNLSTWSAPITNSEYAMPTLDLSGVTNPPMATYTYMWRRFAVDLLPQYVGSFLTNDLPFEMWQDNTP